MLDFLWLGRVPPPEQGDEETVALKTAFMEAWPGSVFCIVFWSKMATVDDQDGHQSRKGLVQISKQMLAYRNPTKEAFDEAGKAANPQVRALWECVMKAAAGLMGMLNPRSAGGSVFCVLHIVRDITGRSVVMCI